MFRSDRFSESAAKVLLFISAIAGSVLVASVTAPSSFESQARQLDDSPYVETSDKNPGALFAIAVGSGVALCLGVNAMAARSIPSARRSAVNSLPSSQSVRLNQASRALQRQLLLLLQDDQAIAQRLLTHASLRHPGETPNWYAEKVIYDLERDRGAR